MTVTPHPAHPKAALSDRFKILAQSNGIKITPITDDEVLVAWDPGCEAQAHVRCTHALAMMRLSATMRVIPATDAFVLKVVAL